MKTAYSTRADGSMKTADGKIDLKNIEAFLQSKQLPREAVCMGQVHGGTVELVIDADQKIIPDVDALVTDNINVSLCVVTADCLPILFFDQKKHVIGVIHAGSKGLLNNIIHNTFMKVVQGYRSQPEDIIVTIGPAIEKKCYEVGNEIIEQFENAFSWFIKSVYTSRIGNKYLLDLKKVALQCLIKEGILNEHITISELCTKCNTDTLYTYRGGDKTGRFISAITIL